MPAGSRGKPQNTYTAEHPDRAVQRNATKGRSSPVRRPVNYRDEISAAGIGLGLVLGGSSAAQAPDVNKILADIRAKDKGQLAVSEEDGRFLRLMIASTGRKRALEIGGASGYSAIWMGAGAARDRRKARVRSSTTRFARRSSPRTSAGRPERRRPGGRRRRVRRDPEAPGHVRLRLPRRVEARLQEVLRPDVSAAGQGRPVHGAQRGEQAERDGGLPRRDPAESFSLDGHRGAVRRRDLAVV